MNGPHENDSGALIEFTRCPQNGQGIYKVRVYTSGDLDSHQRCLPISIVTTPQNQKEEHRLAPWCIVPLHLNKQKPDCKETLHVIRHFIFLAVALQTTRSSFFLFSSYSYNCMQKNKRTRVSSDLYLFRRSSACSSCWRYMVTFLYLVPRSFSNVIDCREVSATTLAPCCAPAPRLIGSFRSGNATQLPVRVCTSRFV